MPAQTNNTQLPQVPHFSSLQENCGTQVLEQNDRLSSIACAPKPVTKAFYAKSAGLVFTAVVQQQQQRVKIINDGQSIVEQRLCVRHQYDTTKDAYIKVQTNTASAHGNTFALWTLDSADETLNQALAPVLARLSTQPGAHIDADSHLKFELMLHGLMYKGASSSNVAERPLAEKSSNIRAAAAPCFPRDTSRSSKAEEFQSNGLGMNIESSQLKIKKQDPSKDYTAQDQLKSAYNGNVQWYRVKRNIDGRTMLLQLFKLQDDQKIDHRQQILSQLSRSVQDIYELNGWLYIVKHMPRQ